VVRIADSNMAGESDSCCLMILLANSNTLIARQSGSNSKSLKPKFNGRLAPLRYLAVGGSFSTITFERDVPSETAPVLKI